MIKDALEYIVGMKKPNITEIGGQTYSDKKLERMWQNIYCKCKESSLLHCRVPRE